MKLAAVVFLFLCVGMPLVSGWIWGSGGSTVSEIREEIAATAERKVGSTYWSYASSCCHGPNTNKCNYFVYHVGREAGAKMPTRSWWRGPVGAGEGGWGKASKLDYWKRVDSPKRGDIVGAHYPNDGPYHVGIYVGANTTVSANAVNIGKNKWPFGTENEKGEDIVYWRYQG